jgi:hypothetical protein
MINDERLIFTVIIAGRTKKDAILTALPKVGVHVINTMYGHGTVKAGYLESLLGLVPEHNKVVIITVAKYGKSTAVMQMLKDEFHFDDPNTGIAFAIPVEKLSF